MRAGEKDVNEAGARRDFLRACATHSTSGRRRHYLLHTCALSFHTTRSKVVLFFRFSTLIMMLVQLQEHTAVSNAMHRDMQAGSLVARSSM